MANSQSLYVLSNMRIETDLLMLDFSDKNIGIEVSRDKIENFDFKIGIAVVWVHNYFDLLQIFHLSHIEVLNLYNNIFIYIVLKVVAIVPLLSQDWKREILNCQSSLFYFVIFAKQDLENIKQRLNCQELFVNKNLPPLIPILQKKESLKYTKYGGLEVSPLPIGFWTAFFKKLKAQMNFDSWNIFDMHPQLGHRFIGAYQAGATYKAWHPFASLDLNYFESCSNWMISFLSDTDITTLKTLNLLEKKKSPKKKPKAKSKKKESSSSSSESSSSDDKKSKKKGKSSSESSSESIVKSKKSNKK